jgi:hypothetical protein
MARLLHPLTIAGCLSVFGGVAQGIETSECWQLGLLQINKPVYANNDDVLICTSPDPLPLYQELADDIPAKKKFAASRRDCQKVKKDTDFLFLGNHEGVGVFHGDVDRYHNVIRMRKTGDYELFYGVLSEWSQFPVAQLAALKEECRIKLEEETRRREAEKLEQAKRQAEQRSAWVLSECTQHAKDLPNKFDVMMLLNCGNFGFRDQMCAGLVKINPFHWAGLGSKIAIMKQLKCEGAAMEAIEGEQTAMRRQACEGYARSPDRRFVMKQMQELKCDEFGFRLH